jgi:thiol-disulfide isomerase/thioredoxin
MRTARPSARSLGVLLLACAGAAGLSAGLSSCGESKQTLARELAGKKPPELDLVGGTWFNVPGGTLSLASSLGKVVYLEFGFPTCPGCRFMAPHMQRWHEQWGEKGLVVISVENGPQTPFSSTEARVRAGTVTHPVLHDAHGRNTELFGVQGFPSAYLLDRNGKVVWEGVPFRNVPALEAKLKATLGL